MVDNHGELAIYHQNKQTSPNKPSSKAKVIKEVVSPEVSKLSYSVVNKKQGDQMQFSKRLLAR